MVKTPPYPLNRETRDAKGFSQAYILMMRMPDTTSFMVRILLSVSTTVLFLQCGVASSFRTVEAVWRNYPALYKHFKIASEDPSCDSVTNLTYSGLSMRISSHAFVNNLSIMCDALQ